jgi:hypothetical protein
MVLGVTGYRHAQGFTRLCETPRETQESLLRRILEINASTKYGQDHGFGSIRTIEDYQRQVPVNQYDDLEPYILAASRGEPAQLTTDPPILFATTSGTTGKPKYIPVTKTSRRDKSTVTRLWLYHASTDYPHLFDGNILGVVSPEVEGVTEGGIPYGAESGHVYRNMPRLMRNVYAVPYEVYALENYDSKYYAMLRIAVDKNLTVIATANPSTILLLTRKMVEYQEQIIRDIRDGTLDGSREYPPEIREQLERELEPDPQRARYLDDCMGKSGRLIPQDVWPNLAMIGTWKGGSVGLYLREFEGLFNPETPIRDWGYLASELRGSVPISDEGCGGVLTIETNFFEFVADDDSESANPTFLTTDQLEDEKEYFVYPTTTGGLYRYDMNDLVRVNGFYKNTPIVEFIQKGKGVSSLTGEKLYEAQVCTAVSRSHDILGNRYEFVVATPEWDDPPRYVLLMEETCEPIDENVWREWLASMDEQMRDLNEEYHSKRKSMRLDTPQVKVVKRGEFLRYRQRRVAEGAPDGQFKMLKLNPDLEFQKQFEIERTVTLE